MRIPLKCAFVALAFDLHARLFQGRICEQADAGAVLGAAQDKRLNEKELLFLRLQGQDDDGNDGFLQGSAAVVLPFA